jgi:pectate lyase
MVGTKSFSFAGRILILVMLMVVKASSVFAADGFGRNTTGGAGGLSVTVNNAADFITCATSPSPYVITVFGTITLPANIHVASNKTIQGADSNATINGDLRIGGPASNVIVQYLNITNPAGVGDGDGITVIDGAKNIFITHCTFTDCADGECDITNQSDSITVSWCRFRYATQSTHRNVNLIGSSDQAVADLGRLHVTMHHCWYDQLCTERMPSVRFGRVHVYDNYYSAMGNNYCVRTRLYAECLVENNYFENVQNPWELLTTNGTPNGKLYAANNNVSFMDSSHGVTWVSGWYTAPGQTQALIPGTDTVFTPPYSYALDDAQDVKTIVMAYAGNRGCISGIPQPPTLSSPPNGATDVSTSPTLRWNSFNGATSYRLQVSSDSSFSNTVVDQSSIVDTSYAVGGLVGNNRYYWRVSVTNAVGTSPYSSTWSFTTAGQTLVEQLGPEQPTEFYLHQNYPNPFNPTTTVEFSIPRQTLVVLAIYNTLGMQIQILVDKYLPAGHYRTQWIPVNVPSGVYFCQLRSSGFSDTKKLLLLR